MTPAQHYAKADEILDAWGDDYDGRVDYERWREDRDYWVSVAQIHATLATVGNDTALRAQREVQP